MEQPEIAEDAAQQFSQRVRERLCQFGNEEKRLLLEALQIKVVVYADHVEVQGAIPSYATTGQTWA